MKLNRRTTRTFILSLLIVSVFVPIFLLSGTVKNLNSGVPDGFIEDLSSIKHRTDVLKANVIETEGGQSLKEPPPIVYKDDDLSSLVSYFSEMDYGSDVSLDAKNSIEDALDRKVTKQGTEQDQQNQTVVLPTASGRKELPTRTTPKHNESNNSGQNEKSVSRRLVDEKVKQMKDQVIRAQLYLAFASPERPSSLMRELKQRIKQVQRAIGDSTKDTDLHRSASLKMRLMEATLSKASRIFTDCDSMRTKLRAMTYNAEELVRAHKNQASFLIQLAERTTPKGLHCLSMRLTAQYFTLPHEQKFPNQHRVYDPNLYHFAIFSDNILACSVVIYSTIAASKVPEKLVFHIVTDSVHLPSMSMWLLLNLPENSTIHIENIDTFTWLSSKYGVVLQKENSHDPRYTSALNHLRFYLPDVYPMLNKIVLLDHDVVVLRDLTPLWSVHMKGKVNAAVETCQEDEPSFRRMDMFINVSDPFVAKEIDPQACTWAFGMNIFDVQEWRKQNLTGVYHKYLHMGETRPIYKAGSLPLGWLTFYNNTVALKRSWHILGLGYESGVSRNDIDKAMVIHYDGAMKPWLDIGLEKYKSYWRKHVNYDHPYLQQCNIHP